MSGKSFRKGFQDIESIILLPPLHPGAFLCISPEVLGNAIAGHGEF